MLSFSQLKLFKQCELQWKFRYIDKLPVKIKPHLTKGKNVHSLLETYGTSEFNETFDKIKNQEVIHIFERFSNSELGFEILNKPSVREMQFYLDSEMNPSEKENAILVGYIDRINLSNNKVEIIDFKTGKYVDLKYQEFDQLIIYAIFVFKKYKNIEEIKLRFVYVEHNEENTLVLKRESIEFYINELLKDIQKLENTKISGNFKKNITKLCDWCDYKEQCKNY